MNNVVIDTIMNRRSTRSYKNNQISEEELQIILDAGIQAPTANNTQPWHFTVIQNKEFINYISDTSKEVMRKSEDEKVAKMGNSELNLFYGAPTIVVVSGKEEERSSLVDCCAAIENMLIAGESMGVGSVWVGLVRFFFAMPNEVEKFNLPNGYKPYYAVALGYKKDDSKAKGPSKREKNVVNYIR